MGARTRAKKRRRQLTEAQAEQAGRKAAEILEEEPGSLTAKGAKKKRSQAFAIAVSKLFGKGKSHG